MEYKGFTYTPTPKTAWDNLSMLEKSEMMKVAVRNGITDLKTIREKYNEFAMGGTVDTDQSYSSRRIRKFEDGGFTSELDWSPDSWFSKRVAKPDGTLYNDEEAARLASHVPEYNNIEQTAKANGTWLKMPDGSTWKGDPRSWVMMQSEAYKKNYSPKPWYTGQAEWPTTFDYGEGKVNTNKVTRAPYYNSQMWFSDNKNYGDTFAHYIDDNAKSLLVDPDSPNFIDPNRPVGVNFLAAIPKEGNYRHLTSPEKGTHDYWTRLPYTLSDNTIQRLDSSEITVKDDKDGVPNANIRADGQKVLTDDVVNWSKSLGDEGIFMNQINDGPVLTPEGTFETPIINEFISQPGFTNKVKFIEGNTGDFDIDNPYKYANNLYVKDNSLDNNYAALGGPLVEAAMNEYKKGGSIHIKPSHRGRLTELKKRTGKTEAELYRTGGPAVRKMITFARNARKWKHGEGGPLQGPIVDMAMANNQSDVNLYGWGDWLDKAYNGVKNAVNKGREVVRTLGLDKSPSNHLMSWMGVSDSDMTNKNQSKNNNLGFFATGALDAGRMSGINKVVKGDKNDIHYRTNLFNMVDPTNAVPDNIIDVLGHAITISKAKSEKTYPYKREHQDATADAAWAKRLGLPYDKTLLPDNTDGSVRLSQALEQEIPTDTTLLKNRIAENEKLLTKIYGKKRKSIEVAVDLDKAALNALRETYSTGKPVGLNEFTHNSRGWLDADLDKVVTPLSLLHRYTVQYDKAKNRMNYWDTYDFDEFEDFVPGEPFFIKGSIDLNKKK